MVVQLFVHEDAPLVALETAEEGVHAPVCRGGARLAESIDDGDEPRPLHREVARVGNDETRVCRRVLRERLLPEERPLHEPAEDLSDEAVILRDVTGPDFQRCNAVRAHLRRVHLSPLARRAGLEPPEKVEAEAFYGEHSAKGFFGTLVAYMTSGPVYVAVLEREGAVAHWRAVLGATDPAKADAGTVRKEFGQSIERNAAHGSANVSDAAREVVFFFSHAELI